MRSPKISKLTYGLLALCGAIYFLGFSQVDVPFPFLKVYVTMIPIQLAAFIYVGWVIRRRQLDAEK